jgi:small-conductance mechanosensitive channel
MERLTRSAASSAPSSSSSSKIDASFYQRPQHMHVAVAKIVIAVVVIVAIVLLMQLVEGWIDMPCSPTDRATDATCKSQRRASTISSALLTFGRAATVVVGFMVILHFAGLKTTTLFTLASIFSLVLGLAAQSMLRDVFSGLMFLAEDQMLIGDFVHLFVVGASSPLSGSFGDSSSGPSPTSTSSASTISGIVENVSLRRVKLRNFDNELIYVPNSLINAVVNGSQQYPLVRLRISTSRTDDIRAVTAAVRRAMETLAADPEFTKFYPSQQSAAARSKLVRTLDAVGMSSPDPEMLGVSDIRPDGTLDVLVRFMSEVGQQWSSGRYARQKIVEELQRDGLGDVVRVLRSG